MIHDRFHEWVEHGCFALAWARYLAAGDDHVAIDRRGKRPTGALSSARPAKGGEAARRRQPGLPRRSAGVRLRAVWLARLQMEDALRFAGYDYSFTPGKGFHTLAHGRAIFPDSLCWLWRYWGPES